MSEVSKILIACEALRPELDLLNSKLQESVKIFYIKQGLHDFPDQLRTEVQAFIYEFEETYSPEVILMAYGFCGRGLYGIKSKKATIIIPRVHDCIPLILGDGPDKEVRPVEYTETYWLSAGWLKYSQVEHITEREKRYNEYIELYGQDSADYLLEVELSWKQNYKEVCLIYWEELDSPELRADADFVSTDMNLPYNTRLGNSWYLQELLDGGVDKTKFFHIVPGQTMDIGSTGLLEITNLAQE